MKRILSWVLALVIMAGFAPAFELPVAVAAGHDSNDSSHAPDWAALSQNDINDNFLAPIDPLDPDAIKIYTAQQLSDMRNNLSGSYVLMSDIDLSTFNGGEWVPIGDSYSTAFTGIFDGQGHVISNLTVTGECVYAGLFGYAENAEIKNVGLEGTNIDITNFYSAYAGGIIGYGFNSGSITISNCYNTGSVYASADLGTVDVGGIAGCSSGYYSTITINDCYNMSDVFAVGGYSAYAGGICGIGGNRYATISDCYNTGNVTAYSESGFADAGGICGVTYGPVNDCYNTGFVTAYSDFCEADAGGICGFNYRDAVTGNCFNTGYVSAYSDFGVAHVGGVCGENFGTINNCYNTGGVSALGGYHAMTGGICGMNRNSADNCYWNLDSDQIVDGIPRDDGAKSGVGVDYGADDTTTALTTAQMKLKSSFSGYDFDTVWEFRPGINNGYPVLRVFSDAWSDDEAFVVEDCVLIEYNGRGGDVVIPDDLGIKHIACDVFWYNNTLTSVVIPNGVVDIGDMVFANCVNLTSVTFPDSVTEIYYEVFSGCTSLTSITIPKSARSIGWWVFEDTPDVTIYGYARSYAEVFANENDIQFIALPGLPPVKITTEAQLRAIADNLAGDYLLTKDITLTEDWDVIAADWSWVSPAFTGTFDGGGHTIYNVRIPERNDYSSKYELNGFFGMTEHAIIKNLTIHINYGGASDFHDGDVRAGGLVGHAADTIIENCAVIGNIYINTEYNADIGGMIGVIDNSTIRNSYADVTFNTTSKYPTISAFAGWGNDSVIENCYAKGKFLFAEAYSVSGFIGAIYDSRIENCYSSVEASENIAVPDESWSGSGAFSNYANNTEINNCYYNGDLFKAEQTKAQLATELTAAEMEDKESFAGFTFDAVWDISPGINGGYPYLHLLPPPAYTISIAYSANGRVTADKTSAEAGETITLDVAPNAGYRLSADTLKYNDILITGNSFTMPSEKVRITAEFEQIIVHGDNGSAVFTANAWQLSPDFCGELIVDPGMGWGISALFSDDPDIWAEGNDFITVDKDTGPFSCIVKAEVETNVFKYIGIEKPIAISAGTYDNSTWHMTGSDLTGNALLKVMDDWEVKSIFHDNAADGWVYDDGEQTVTVDESAGNFDAIIKLEHRLTKQVKYIGISKPPSPAQIAEAIASIEAYTDSAAVDAPVAVAYTTAGVTGVVPANVDAYNALVNSLYAGTCDTKAKIQDVVDVVNAVKIFESAKGQTAFKGKNSALDNITSNLILPALPGGTVAISLYITVDTTDISADGTVTRPSGADISGSIAVRFTKNDKSIVSSSINVMVKQTAPVASAPSIFYARPWGSMVTAKPNTEYFSGYTVYEITETAADTVVSTATDNFQISVFFGVGGAYSAPDGVTSVFAGTDNVLMLEEDGGSFVDADIFDVTSYDNGVKDIRPTGTLAAGIYTVTIDMSKIYSQSGVRGDGTKTLKFTVLPAYTGEQPTEPTEADKTSDSITLNALAVDGQTVEYGICKGQYPSPNSEIWQDSEVFDGLTPDTDYYFCARVKATSTTAAGETVVACTEITTNSGGGAPPPQG